MTKKCSNCEYFHVVSIPDKLNEGLAVCEKYGLSLDLWSNYKKKIENLTCYNSEENE